MHTHLQQHLDALYARYNRRDYVAPDPLQVLYRYEEPGDIEVAGLIAAALAFGQVPQILRSIDGVLEALPRPRSSLMACSARQLQRRFAAFRHRYVAAEELVALLLGIQAALEEWGSLEGCFQHFDSPGEPDVCGGLTGFAGMLRTAGGVVPNYLLPDPARGSACKRLHLYLRWMVRRDAVDPGPWENVSPARLLVPVDTHMHRLARGLALTGRRQADLRTAREITRAFRQMAPGDPARYDFALTRLGIRTDAYSRAFSAAWLAAAGYMNHELIEDV